MAPPPTSSDVAFELERPTPFLMASSASAQPTFDLDHVFVAQAWALVGIAALARRERLGAALVHMQSSNGPSRFARAIGLDEAIAGLPKKVMGEAGRTVRIQRVRTFGEIEPVAAEISRLIVQDDEDVRRTLAYVMVELLRNVVQHSGDELGGVVAAQRMDAQQHYDRPMIQVAVGDAGRGIHAALRGMHPSLEDARDAVNRSLEPHVSGTFEQGMTGAPGGQNAGMGLFFISEMAKRTAGRLLVASRGAALMLEGDPEFGDNNHQRFEGPPGTGFPGTLVAFELPLGGVNDYQGLLQVISSKAKERMPQRVVQHWFRFEAPPAKTLTLLVNVAAENTAAAAEYAATQLLPRIIKREPLTLDFRNLEVCTQSYLHALLSEAVRVAWAFRTPIYVANARPAVRSGLELVESYSLGG